VNDYLVIEHKVPLFGIGAARFRPWAIYIWEMMLRYLGWTEAADLILKGLDGAIASKRVTYDFARLMAGATEIKCSEFGSNIISKM